MLTKFFKLVNIMKENYIAISKNKNERRTAAKFKVLWDVHFMLPRIEKISLSSFQRVGSS